MKKEGWNKYNDIQDYVEDITLEEFDNYQGSYKFSKKYQEKKMELLNSFCDNHKMLSKRHKSLQIAAACIFTFLIVPATCYAAMHYYQVQIQKNNYQTNIVVSPDAEAEANIKDIEFKPVKLVFEYLPEGSESYPGDDSKYYVPMDKNESAHGVSPFLSKLDLDEEMFFSTLYSLDVTEFTAGTHPAYLVQREEDMEYNKVLYVLFEDEHYMAGAYLGYDITVGEAEKIAEGIILEETDSEHATAAGSVSELQQEVEANVEESAQAPDTYYGIGESLPTSDMYPDCTITVDKVEFFDSISQFDNNNFFMGSLEGVLDKEGNLTKYERKEWKLGDGINTLDQVTDTKIVGRKFAYVTISVANSSKVEVKDYSTCSFLKFMKETENGKIVVDEKIDNYGTSIDFEPVYFDASLVNNTNTHFFYMDIPADKTVTYHIGYFVDEDLTNEVFLANYYGSEYGTISANYSLTDIREKE